jgi:serralysin
MQMGARPENGAELSLSPRSSAAPPEVDRLPAFFGQLPEAKLSGTLTITQVFSPGGIQETSRTQVGGTGQHDIMVIETYWGPGTRSASGLPLTKEVYANFGPPRDDLIVGDSFTTHIEGGYGNDTLSSPRGSLVGDEGDDVLRGGDGDNGLYGGPGDDTIDGGAGFDEVGFGGASGVTVDLNNSGPQQTGEGLDVLIGVEAVTGTAFGDTLTGDAQSNLLRGAFGDDVVYGLGGDDTITDGNYYDEDGYGSATARDYLRGGDGNDLISGGADSDDLNGNQGNDTVHGDAGDDWAVGGKDHDLLFGDDGADLVYGNLGNDTGDGGAGNDVVRGGQGDDSLAGGSGNDWLSGDLGSDTISGGAGADVFHSFGAAGLDRITDFNAAEGDRIQLDPGTTYSASQSGADVVISLSGGGQVVLAGVSLASLTGGWIFAG